MNRHAGCKLHKEKATRKAASNSNSMIDDHAAIKASFDFRRYAMNPTPAKPGIIMAQVEGSGTAATGPVMFIENTPPLAPSTARWINSLARRSASGPHADYQSKVGKWPFEIDATLFRALHVLEPLCRPPRWHYGPKGLPMTRETATRAQIALLIYMMISGVLFGAGVILVLTWPALSANAGFWISAVVGASFILAAPVAWWIAPRMRARYWRRRRAADHASHLGTTF